MKPFEHFPAGSLEAVEYSLLERVVALFRHPEALADVVDDHGGPAVTR
jgi:hypothetical protein